MKNLAIAPYLLRAFLIWILLTAPPPPCCPHSPSWTLIREAQVQDLAKSLCCVLLLSTQEYERELANYQENLMKCRGEGNLAMD